LPQKATKSNVCPHEEAWPIRLVDDRRWVARASPGSSTAAPTRGAPRSDSDPPATPKPIVTVSGYLQAQLNVFLDGNDDDTTNSSTVLIRRLRLRFKGEVLKGLGYTIMIDPSTASNLLRDGFLAVTAVPHHEIRIGQQKTQFGYENPESSTKLFTINRTFASDALGRGSDLRDIGVGVLGTWPLPAGFGVDYQLTLVNGSGPNVIQDTTDTKNFWGRAGASLKGGAIAARLGGSYAFGDHVRRATEPGGMDVIYYFRRLGVDAVVDTPWLLLIAELLMGTNELPTGDVDAQGFYVTAVGKTPFHLGPIARYEQYDPNTDADGDLQRRYTLGLYYDLKSVDVRFIANIEIDDSDVGRDHAFLLWGQVIFP
jgi:hypothetical protein